MRPRATSGAWANEFTMIFLRGYAYFSHLFSEQRVNFVELRQPEVRRIHLPRTRLNRASSLSSSSCHGGNPSARSLASLSTS